MFNTQPVKHTKASLLQFFKDSKGETGVKFNATTGALSLVPMGADAASIPRRSVESLVEFHPAPGQVYECYVGADSKDSNERTGHVSFRSSLSGQPGDITRPVAIKFDPKKPRDQQFASAPLLPERPVILTDDEFEIDTASLKPKPSTPPFNKQKTIAFAYAEFETWLETALEKIEQLRSQQKPPLQCDEKSDAITEDIEADEAEMHQVYVAVLNTGQPITESDAYWFGEQQRAEQAEYDTVTCAVATSNIYWQWRSAARGVALTAALTMFMDVAGRGLDECLRNNYYTFPAFAIDGAAVSVAAMLWPLGLGCFFLYDYYSDAKANLERQLKRPLHKLEVSEIEKNTLKLGVKIFSGIVGMELGMHIAAHIVKAIGQVALTAAGAINPVGHLVAALIVGLASALFIGTANIILNLIKNNGYRWDNDLAKDTGKLMLVTFIGASLWYAISILDIIPGSNLAIAVANSVIKSLLSYLTIKCVFFDIYKLFDGKEVKDRPYSDAQEGAQQYNYMVTNAFGTARDTVGAVLDKFGSSPHGLLDEQRAIEAGHGRYNGAYAITA